MQLALLAIAYVGIEATDLGIVVNALGALGITFLPAVLRRDRRFTMHVSLTLWVTGAVLLHAAGTLGPYQTVPWFDNLTHATSASVVAAVGYAAARSLDVHSEQLRLTPWFTFGYLLLFVMAAGVLWELLEYGVTLAAVELGQPTPLVQSGLDDTVSDLVYDTVGALVVALFGTMYLENAVGERPASTDGRHA
ncbi:hypothetical protein [Haloarchaeobius amylolyticus]|uniref:hypothetical protein n=1 Tax=Haloarchaeobius amylolyticus TaxID=1198296 RepID=UPI0026E5354D|nr:hypothetical protein [Haloarchaeobius amylolyticus]